MTTQRHLDNAPIVEAVVDIKVKLPKHIDATALRQIHASISNDYPKKQELIQRDIKIEVGKLSPEAPTHDIRHYGYRYASADDKQVMQVRLDGFTFNKLKPYKTWEMFRDEARELYGIFTFKQLTLSGLHVLLCVI